MDAQAFGREASRSSRGNAAPRWLKPVVFVALATPLLTLGWDWLMLFDGGDALGANPVERTIHRLGETGLRILLLALAVTPIHRVTGWTPIMTVRRVIGLWAFGYVFLHFAIFFGLDLLGSIAELWEEIRRRWFILFGMGALLLLLPLAVTSTRGWIRRLGGRNWQRLHRAVYIAGLLAIIHVVLEAKGRQAEPLVYGAILAVLLLLRFLPTRPGRYWRLS